MTYVQNTCLLLGRFLIGMYFILPGISKITGFEAMSAYMAEHNVPMIPVLLVVTIILQLGCGTAVIVGFKGQLAAFILAGLTLVISLFMHNFWDMEEGTARAHETQNFFKNLGLMGGLLAVAALGTGRFSLDSKVSQA
jgi:putative oxidoreductase